MSSVVDMLRRQQPRPAATSSTAAAPDVVVPSSVASAIAREAPADPAPRATTTTAAATHARSSQPKARSSTPSSSSAAASSSSSAASDPAQSPLSANAALLATLPWVERFAPVAAAELCVHKKRIEEVEAWIQIAIQQAGRRAGATNGKAHKVLLLTGPPGAGKTALIRSLASSLRFEICEWVNPVRESWKHSMASASTAAMLSASGTSEERASNQEANLSTVVAFQEFLGRSDRYNTVAVEANQTSTTSSNAGLLGVLPTVGQADGSSPSNLGKVILVEDMPHLVPSQYASFHDVVRNAAAHARYPVIFIISDTRNGESEVRNLFPLDVLETLPGYNAPRVHRISFNAVSQTALVKAITRVHQLALRSSSILEVPQLDKSEIATLALTSSGDVRAAINALQFYCLEQKVLQRRRFAEMETSKTRQVEPNSNGRSTSTGTKRSLQEENASSEVRLDRHSKVRIITRKSGGAKFSPDSDAEDCVVIDDSDDETTQDFIPARKIDDNPEDQSTLDGSDDDASGDNESTEPGWLKRNAPGARRPLAKQIPDAKDLSVAVVAAPTSLLATGRDTSLFLFHALGKILNCKRGPACLPMEELLTTESNRRRELLMNPEEVIDQTHVSPELFVAYLHQNYSEFYADLDDISHAADHLSDADLLLGGWRNKDSLQSHASLVAARGIAYERQHPAPQSWRPLHKPEWFASVRAQRTSRDTFRSLFLVPRALSQGLDADSPTPFHMLPVRSVITELLPIVGRFPAPRTGLNPRQMSFLHFFARFTTGGRATIAKLDENDNDERDEPPVDPTALVAASSSLASAPAIPPPITESSTRQTATVNAPLYMLDDDIEEFD
ncbi:hypothetical protein CAOG_06005 [Capsaspora owczarzaki ATCC 30864]|uniref:Cell cycle checkpoint protein RAD17 n=1 Tax=Capsaspora owczarzaki (strain ATCC 30864) TaxID=595528 RepID=A0A0D2VVP9_CAPO3|nr:hypothetical protein CAOG_06005 [Capsaspora owczarzaki ATCC 30864]KJE95562.1 hypothetical protein CAOG_006005 [Capsaspora owczarzaki ATCC 30864]|eukprot:XP_004345595.2 hypothetical protein CAOG_06005 [Capsaspora owczarzaki ATCC 30864]